MKKWLLAVIFSTVLVLGACGGSDDSGSEPADNETVDASEAEDIYKENCATCHGGNLTGGEGPDLTDVGSTLSKDEIEKQIEDGGNGMPPGLVSGDERETLAQWLSEKE